MLRLLLLCTLLAPLWAHAQIPLFDRDPRGAVPEEVEIFKEEQLNLPAAPEQKNLIAFDPGRPTTMKFYVDAASVSVGQDQVVRYTLVVTGDEDTRNVMYEGVRCKSDERKTYAYGRRDGTWSLARDPQWEAFRYDVPRRTLYRNFLCPLRGPVQSADEAVGALRNGVHPLVKQFSPYE